MTFKWHFQEQVKYSIKVMIKVQKSPDVFQYMFLGMCLYNKVEDKEIHCWRHYISLLSFREHAILIVFTGCSGPLPPPPLPSKLLNMLIRLFILTSRYLCLRLISGANGAFCMPTAHCRVLL